MKQRSSALLLFATVLGLGACSSETRDSIRTDVSNAVSDVSSAVDDATKNAIEALARNIATQQGEEQFTNAGKALDGPLTCEANIDDGYTKVDINCTGTVQGGGAATLTGTTNEVPGASVIELDGQFSGAVDGTEVFSTQRLGG